MFLKNLQKVFLPAKSWKNFLKKLHTYGSWEFFFSAVPTAQKQSQPAHNLISVLRILLSNCLC